MGQKVIISLRGYISEFEENLTALLKSSQDAFYYGECIWHSTRKWKMKPILKVFFTEQRTIFLMSRYFYFHLRGFETFFVRKFSYGFNNYKVLVKKINIRAFEGLKPIISGLNRKCVGGVENGDHF